MSRNIVFCICVLLTGCGHLTLHRGDEVVPSTTAATTQNYTIDALLFGTIPLTKLPQEGELCPTSRIETLNFNMEGSQVLLAIVTLGIYTPHDVRVDCAP